MPVYGYKCGNCENEFKEMQSISNRASCECPDCQATAKRDIVVEMRLSSGMLVSSERVEGVWDDISSEPIYVKNKSHLRDVCKRSGVYAPGVFD